MPWSPAGPPDTPFFPEHQALASMAPSRGPAADKGSAPPFNAESRSCENYATLRLQPAVHGAEAVSQIWPIRP
jgi:hypothetical protein